MKTSCEEVVTVHDVYRTFSVRRGVFRQQVVEALRGVSFCMSQGETFALLGPNGAGKTTMLKILATLLSPTSGEVVIFGYRLSSQAHAVRQIIGVTFGGERGFFNRLSARENLIYAACLYDLPMKTWNQVISSALELVGLSDVGYRPVGTFSRGMKQRLHIARAILHDPQLLILDEPTTGLDPEAAYQVRDLIQRLAEAGKTILFSTHQMIEAEKLADRVAVLAHGRLRKIGTPLDYINDLGFDFVIELQRITKLEALRVRDQYKVIPGALDCYISAANLSWNLNITVKASNPNYQEVISALGLSEDMRVMIRASSLEDAYLKLVGDSGIDENSR